MHPYVFNDFYIDWYEHAPSLAAYAHGNNIRIIIVLYELPLNIWTRDKCVQ